MNVEDVISAALQELNEAMPGVVQAVIKEKAFITYMYEPGVNVKGVQTGTTMVIADFTKKIEYDPVMFQQISQRLYEQFACVNKWYRC